MTRDLQQEKASKRWRPSKRLAVVQMNQGSGVCFFHFKTSRSWVTRGKRVFLALSPPPITHLPTHPLAPGEPYTGTWALAKSVHQGQGHMQCPTVTSCIRHMWFLESSFNSFWGKVHFQDERNGFKYLNCLCLHLNTCIDVLQNKPNVPTKLRRAPLAERSISEAARVLPLRLLLLCRQRWPGEWLWVCKTESLQCMLGNKLSEAWRPLVTCQSHRELGSWAVRRGRACSVQTATHPPPPLPATLACTAAAQPE